MKIKILTTIVIIFCISFSMAYTPQSFDSVDLVLDTGYTAPSFDNVELVLGEAPTDSCSPSSPLSADYFYQCSDFCNLTSNVDAGGFDINFNGTGIITIDGVDITNYNDMHIEGQDLNNICVLRLVNGGNILN